LNHDRLCAAINELFLAEPHSPEVSARQGFTALADASSYYQRRPNEIFTNQWTFFAEHDFMTFNFEKSKSYLVCPKCHSDLVPDGESLVCTNPDVRLRYPILEDIPRLLVEEAEELTPDAWAAAMQRAGRSQ